MKTSAERSLDAALHEAVTPPGFYPPSKVQRFNPGDRVVQSLRPGEVGVVQKEEFDSEHGRFYVIVDWDGLVEKENQESLRLEKDTPTTPKTAVTPPGREKQVKKLKTVPGVKNPWAVAWGQYSKKHKKSSVEAALDAAMAERQPKFAATDFPPGRAVAQQVKDQGTAQSFLDRVKAKGQAWLGEFFQKLRSEGYEDEAMMLENASQAIPLADEGTPGEAVPGFEPISTRAAPEILARQKQASREDGEADEIEVDGHPARILKRLGQIGGKEAIRVELIEGPRRGEVFTAVEG